MADIKLNHYLQEGQLLPAFDFRDLNGRHCTSANTRGKVLVLKPWFISCLACIKGFFEFNELADKHKANPKVALLSLALGSADYLKVFSPKRVGTPCQSLG